MLSQSSVDKLNTEFNNDPRMKPILLDVTKDADVANAVAEVKKSGVVLRAIVNNAGVSAFGYTELLTLKRYQFNMEVNFFGTVRMTKAFLPLLRQSKGRIINIGSIGARMYCLFHLSSVYIFVNLFTYSLL